MAATPEILISDAALAPAPQPAPQAPAAAAPRLAMPRHVAVIMDGNGRWAAARGLPRWAGHQAGIAAVRRTVEEARKAGLRYLTLYAFSTENWKRPAVEIAALWELFSRFLVCERADLKEKGIRLVGIGRRDRLPLGPRTALELTERLTASGQNLLLRLAIDYGSQWAIAAAARDLARQALDGKIGLEDIDAAAIARRLGAAPVGFAPDADGADDIGPEAPVQAGATAGAEAGAVAAAGSVPPPDLLIRTGGEMRLSNFLLWECAYAELWFTPELWPEFERSSFAAALAEFAHRRRRFGAAEELPSTGHL
ncbi:MAG: polyprenyl diphosphate synthase [Terriglobales bacterium]